MYEILENNKSIHVKLTILQKTYIWGLYGFLVASVLEYTPVMLLSINCYILLIDSSIDLIDISILEWLKTLDL